MAEAQSAPSPAELLQLAKSHDPQSRARLLDSLVELCRTGAGDDASRALIGPLFADLARRAERDIRLALSNRLANADWAPHALVNILALDEIEIAGPLIAESPVLTEFDLLSIYKLAPLGHRRAVASRPRIGEAVANLILDQDEAEVLSALAGNTSAEVWEQGMQRLVDAAKTVVSLRNKLTRHPRLTADLAARLYEWVGEALRTALGQRFQLDPALLDSAMVKAVALAAGGAEPAAPEEEDLATLQRLVDKLHAADQLRQSALVRALRERRIGLFCVALAKLASLEPHAVVQASEADDPEMLALACAGAGIDRGVYLHLLEGLRDINHGLPGGGAEGARRSLGAFAPFPASAATGAFRRLSAV